MPAGLPTGVPTGVPTSVPSPLNILPGVIRAGGVVSPGPWGALFALPWAWLTPPVSLGCPCGVPPVPWLPPSLPPDRVCLCCAAAPVAVAETLTVSLTVAVTVTLAVTVTVAVGVTVSLTVGVTLTVTVTLVVAEVVAPQLRYGSGCCRGGSHRRGSCC